MILSNKQDGKAVERLMCSKSPAADGIHLRETIYKIEEIHMRLFHMEANLPMLPSMKHLLAQIGIPCIEGLTPKPYENYRAWDAPSYYFSGEQG